MQLRCQGVKPLNSQVWRNEYTLVYSYDFLPSDVGRFCLLYCSLFSEDYRIDIDQLVDFWICEGFLDEYDGIAARNQGYCIVGTLLHACLMEEEEGNRESARCDSRYGFVDCIYI